MLSRDAMLVLLAVLLPGAPLVWVLLTTEPPPEPDTPPEVPLEHGPNVGPPVNTSGGPVPTGRRPGPGYTDADAVAESVEASPTDRLTWGKFLQRLAVLAEALEDDPEVRAQWQALVQSHGLADTPAAYADFSRLRLAHAAFRSGGWAGLRHAPELEDGAEAPDSRRLWQSWRQEDLVTVDASSGELAALLAFVGRGLGVEQVGLFQPSDSLTLTAWGAPAAGGTGRVHVVLPSAQAFLDPVADLGDTTFQPRPGSKVATYTGQDLPPGALLPEVFVRRVLEGARRHGGASAEELTLMRLRGGWFRR